MGTSLHNTVPIISVSLWYKKTAQPRAHKLEEGMQHAHIHNILLKLRSSIMYVIVLTLSTALMCYVWYQCCTCLSIDLILPNVCIAWPLPGLWILGTTLLWMTQQTGFVLQRVLIWKLIPMLDMHIPCTCMCSCVWVIVRPVIIVVIIIKPHYNLIQWHKWGLLQFIV